MSAKNRSGATEVREVLACAARAFLEPAVVVLSREGPDWPFYKLMDRAAGVVAAAALMDCPPSMTAGAYSDYLVGMVGSLIYPGGSPVNENRAHVMDGLKHRVAECLEAMKL